MVHDNAGNLNKLKKLRENIEPSLHIFLINKKSLSDPFATIFFHEIIYNSLRDKEVNILNSPHVDSKENYTIPGYIGRDGFIKNK